MGTHQVLVESHAWLDAWWAGLQGWGVGLGAL